MVLRKDALFFVTEQMPSEDANSGQKTVPTDRFHFFYCVVGDNSHYSFKDEMASKK